MPIRTPDGYLDITNATLRGSEIITTSNVGIANSAPTHTLSVGNKLFVDDSAANVLTVSGNLVATSLKIGQIDLAPSYGLEHVSNVGNTVSNVVQFTNTGTGFVSVSNVGIGTTTSPAGLLDVVGAFRMRYQDMGVTKAHIITGANSASIAESGGTYTYTRGGSGNTGNFLPNPSNIVPKVGQRYRVKLTARSDYAGTIRYECPTSTIITTYDLTTSFKEYTWDFTATGTTMQFAVTTVSGTTSQFNAFSIERLGTGFNVNPTSTAAPVQISGVTHFSDNVGIGTDSPGVPLTVYGSDPADTFGSQVRIVSTSTTGAENSGGVLIFQGHDGVTGRGFASVGGLKENGTSGNHASYLRFSTRASGGGSIAERMRITSTGNVGVGVANPVVKLDVSGIGRFTNNGGSLQLVGTDHTYLEYYPDGVSAGRKGYLGYASATDDNFTINNDAGSGHIILSGGKVSIGTASPRWGLEVTPSSGLGGILSCSDSPIFSHNLYYSGGWKYGTASTGGAYMRMIDSEIQFWNAPNSGSGTWDTAGGAATTTQRMTINEAGNVGIGTNNPIAKLDIDGGAENNTTPALAIRGGLYNTSDLYVLNSYSVTSGVGYGAKVIGVNIKNKVETNNTVQIRNNVGGLTSAGAIYFGSDDTTYQGIFGVLGGDGAAGTTLAELLTVKGNGNVGIGTTSPDTKLHVNGAASATHASLGTTLYPTLGGNWLTIHSPTFDGDIGDNHPDPDGGILFTNHSSNGSLPWGYYMGVVKDVASTTGTTQRFDIGKSHDLNSQNSSGHADTLTPYLTIDNGNVGIGTVNPNVKLHVDSGDIGFEYGHEIKIATSGGSFTAWDAGGGTHTLLGSNWSSYSGAGDVVRFYTPGSQSASMRMILTSAGNVGINTETMIDHRNYGGIHIRDNRGISFAASTNSGSRHWRIRTDDYSDHGSLQIGVSGTNSTPPDAAGEAVMTMTRDRNVGIGHNYPTAPLEIWSGRNADTWSKGQSYFNVLHNANNGYGMSFAVSASHGDGIIQTYNVATGNAQYDLRLQPSGGNVGIGQPNPSCPLHVSGTMGTTGQVRYFNYSGGMSGTNQYLGSVTLRTSNGILSGDYVAVASDERIKKNIVDADDDECLEVLRQLKPKKYGYRDVIERGEDPVWGFIAQEVRDVLPYSTKLTQEIIPNIFELSNVSSSNVITFTNFNTSNLESNATTLIRTKCIDGKDHDIHLEEVIDEHTIRVKEDLSALTGSIDAEGNVISEITTTTITPEEYEALEDKTGFDKNDDDTYTKTSTTYPGNQLFVYGQEVDDFVFLKKEAIWTVATAALQEVDRQLQAEKTKTTALETKLQEAEAKIATLQAEKEAIRSDLSSLVLRVTALES